MINYSDNIGFNPLQYCCLFDNIEIFKKLYKINVDIYQVNKNKESLFDLCIKYNRNDILKYLLENEFNKNNYIFLNHKNESILYQALVYNNNNIVNFLFRNKNYIEKILNIQENEFGLTIFHQLIITQNKNVINKLIDYNFNLNITDYYGNTPIHYSIIENNKCF